MSRIERLTVQWTRRVVALATILAICGIASSGFAGERHKRRSLKYKGVWLFQSVELRGIGANPDRCGAGAEIVIGVRGVDDLGGLFNAESSYCSQGPDSWDIRLTTTYEKIDATTEIVCERQTATREDALCAQHYSKARCFFVGGTGELQGIWGHGAARGVESGSACDGSASPNSNDAGAMWLEGVVSLPKR